MGKKFEGAHPSSRDIVEAYMRLGLGDLLGSPGDYTVFEFQQDLTADTVEAFCIPGRMEPEEIRGLLRDAGLLRRDSAIAA